MAGKKTKPTGDGVVRYESSHLDGAASEKIVKWGHNVTSSPACIAEVARVLKEHVKARR